MPKLEDSKAKLIQPADKSARRVYWLNRIRTKREDGQIVELEPTPEQIAVAIAKCSRSSTPFDQNVDDVNLEKAAEFHEKWVVGYGHGSVAEHAVASVAFENIPQTIVKILEDSRLCSYTEKSSRYQVFTRERIGIPKSLAESDFAPRVAELFDGLYDLYDRAYDVLKPIMEAQTDQGDMPDAAYKAVIKAKVCDRTRYLLPAASLTSLGMTANARNWAHAITKLLSSSDPLAQQIGHEVKSVLHGFENLDRDQALRLFPFPTLLRYADPSKQLISLPDDLRKLAQTALPESNPQSSIKAVTCVYDDDVAEKRIAASLLSWAGKRPFSEVMSLLSKQPQLIEQTLRTALEKRGDHEAPAREFEHAWFSHEIVMDYGAWRDIQRHRLCTQTNQPLGTDLGYDMPGDFKDVDLHHEFSDLMDLARQLNHDLLDAGMTVEAEYVVPMAYKRRLLVTWNLRELFHFIELRSGKKGHHSYRKIAQDIWRTLNETHPLLASFIRVDMSEVEASTLGAKPKGF